MMSSLARRVATSSLCGMSHNGQSSNSLPYPTRMEKVKFGVPLSNVCGAHNDIPGPLLVMILKLNKEAPYKKDVFRAPGHQASMKKLIHFLQNGRLVNIDNYSVYTIASVLKKFLRKLPSGVFGPEREQRLFEVIRWTDVEEKRLEIHRILLSLPIVTQHLLVLLFGTFRAIANSSESSKTGMTSEAISISVAPSFFQSCVSDGNKFAKMEDVQRFKGYVRTASAIMKFMIDNFGIYNLFGRENYEYYARISGRLLKVEENWIFAFKYPPENVVPRKTSLMAEREWLSSETHKWGLANMGLSRQLKEMGGNVEECQSTPTLCSHEDTSDSTLTTRSQANHSHIEDSYARLSMSLEENFFKYSTSKSNSNSPQSFVTVMRQHHPHSHHHSHSHPQSDSIGGGPGGSGVVSDSNISPHHKHQQTSYANFLHNEMLKLDDLKSVNHYAESTKSLTFLPIVHERQTQRMKTRSEWFLNPKDNENVVPISVTPLATSSVVNRSQPSDSPPGGTGGGGGGTLSSNNQHNTSQQEKQQQQQSNKVNLIRKSSSKEKRIVRRSSSKKDKENGNENLLSAIKASTAEAARNSLPTSKSGGGGGGGGGGTKLLDSDCTECDVRQMNITFTYNPRV